MQAVQSNFPLNPHHGKRGTELWKKLKNTNSGDQVAKVNINCDITLTHVPMI